MGRVDFHTVIPGFHCSLGSPDKALFQFPDLLRGQGTRFLLQGLSQCGDIARRYQFSPVEGLRSVSGVVHLNEDPAPGLMHRVGKPSVFRDAAVLRNGELSAVRAAGLADAAVLCDDEPRLTAQSACAVIRHQIIGDVAPKAVIRLHRRHDQSVFQLQIANQNRIV